MLAITPRASEAIRALLATESVPDGSIFRISPEPESGRVVSVADSPRPEDQIVQGDEVEVCVEPTAAHMLDDKELDADLVEGKIGFSIGAKGD